MSRRIHTITAAAVLSGAWVLAAGLAGCSDQSPAALVAQAKQFQQQGQHAAAAIQLKNALAASPEHAEARYLLAMVSLEAGDAASAEKEARKALALKYPQALPLLCKALMAQGQYQKVLDETQAAAKQGNAELMNARADAYLALAQLEPARELFAAVLKAQPKDAVALVGLSRIAARQRDMTAALGYVDQALAAAPQDAAALMFKANLLGLQDQAEAALALYDQVLAVQPAHRSAHVEKAYLEIKGGKFDAAQADLNAAKKITPNSIIVAYAQALLDYSQGRNAAAQESLQKVLRVAPEHAPTLLLAGAVELNLGILPQAEQHLRKYLEIHPQNLYARKLLATTLLRNGQSMKALSVLSPALKSSESDVEMMALAGESYMHVRDFNKASEYLGKASELAPGSAELRTSLGLSKLGKGERERGLRDLEAGAALDSKSLWAGTTLVRTEIGLHNYDKALAAVARLEQSHPGSALVSHLKATALVGKGDIAAARASFAQALAQQASYFPAMAGLIQLDVHEKKPEQARQRLLAYLDKDKKNLDAMLALAGIAALQGQQAEVTAWLEKAMAAKPDAVLPAVRLGEQYLLTGKAQDALNLARKLQPNYPSNTDVLELLARAQLVLKDLNGALETYAKLERLVPEAPQVHVRLAELHMLMKNPAAAADDLKKALQLQPDLIQAHTLQAELLMREKKPEAALAVARLVQKQHSKLPAGYALEGDLLSLQGKGVQALPLYEKAFALGNTSAFAIKLADAYRHHGKPQEAQRVIAQWGKDNPRDPAVAMFQAESSMLAKQYPAAIAQFEAIVQANPANVAALNNLAQAYLQLNDKRALAAAERAHKLAPSHPSILDTLGWVLVQQGEVARALPLLKQAADAASGNTEIRYHYAAALHQAGEKAAARKELKQLLSRGTEFPQAAAARDLLKQL